MLAAVHVAHTPQYGPQCLKPLRCLFKRGRSFATYCFHSGPLRFAPGPLKFDPGPLRFDPGHIEPSFAPGRLLCTFLFLTSDVLFIGTFYLHQHLLCVVDCCSTKRLCCHLDKHFAILYHVASHRAQLLQCENNAVGSHSLQMLFNVLLHRLAFQLRAQLFSQSHSRLRGLQLPFDRFQRGPVSCLGYARCCFFGADQVEDGARRLLAADCNADTINLIFKHAELHAPFVVGHYVRVKMATCNGRGVHMRRH